MKKIIAAILLMTVSVVGLMGCNANNDSITVISREDGSGTRGAFTELFGIEQEDSSGEKIDMTISTAQQTNSTGVMLQSVAQNSSAIGYVSLGSLNDTVKALSVNGVEPTAENIENGSYEIQRPFNIVTGDSESELASDFISYIMSSDGQAIISENGYIAIDSEASPYSGSKPSGSITVAGSSSVSPVMEKLIEAYKLVNTDADIELQTSDSTTGISSVAQGVADIGMASRDLKDSEVESGVTTTVIAMDGIAVIVNVNNEINDISSEDVCGIYTGEITSWSELK